MLHDSDVSGGCWGELHDSPFSLQNAPNFVVLAPLVFLKCVVLLFHEFAFLGLSRQGSSAIFDAKFDCLAWLNEQKDFSCSESSQMYSRSGLGEVWTQVLCKWWLWGESHNSPKTCQITPKILHNALQVLGMLHFNFFSSLGHFWVNCTIHLLVLKIDQILFCSLPKACTSLVCDFLSVLSF